ncbi:TPA: type 1 fimbrial protein [Serratia marcescens]|nr:type 1 fimbrial protein [Serratia marcescens]HAT5029314.1 type 1 fimbrial protein [Serratia marcescens]
MRNINNKLGCRDWQYYLVLVALALMLPLAVTAALWLLPAAHGKTAGSDELIGGTQGVLYVRGALTESACRLEMKSAYQDIQLGEIATGRLQNVGERGTGVGFELHLQDCLRSPASSLDNQSGTIVWAPQQPAVTVSFNAPADADNPQLVQVRGTSGLALRMLDPQGRDVRLGSRGQPLLLTPGQNTLAYRVMPERTRAPLAAGSYFASVDFRLSYD